MLIALISWIITGSIFGFATNAIIRNKGYQENWFWWGFFFGLIAMLVALSKPEKVEPQRTQIDSGGNAGGQAVGQGQSTYQNSANISNTMASDALSEKDSRAENDGEGDILTIPIAQYNHVPKLKPRALTCQPFRGQYAFVIKLKSFREKEVMAVKADIILHTTFGEIYEIKDIGFTNFEGPKYCMVSGNTEYPLPQAQFILIRQADIVIRKVVEGGEMIEFSEEETSISPYEEMLEEEEEEAQRIYEEEQQRTHMKEELIQGIESKNNSEQIRDYLVKYNAEHNNVLPEELLIMVKAKAYAERMHGVSAEPYRRLYKDNYIRKIREYFEEGEI